MGIGKNAYRYRSIKTLIRSISYRDRVGFTLINHHRKNRLLARVTRRSARALRLAPGLRLWAIVKASAVAPDDVGGAV